MTGTAISAVFFFLRYLLPSIPRPIAWSGVAAGVVVLILDTGFEMKLTFSVVSLYLLGFLIIGLATYLAINKDHDSSETSSPAKNQMGEVKNAGGIITQDQKGDNSISKK